jgi:hypothetical protein
MKLKLIDETVIGQHFVCPIEYGDVTGLSDDEEALLNQWLSDFPKAVFVWSDDRVFTRCQITWMMGDCVEVKIYGEE